MNTNVYINTRNVLAMGIRRLARTINIPPENIINSADRSTIGGHVLQGTAYSPPIEAAGVGRVLPPNAVVLNVGNSCPFGTSNTISYINSSDVVRAVVDKRSCKYIVGLALAGKVDTQDFNVLEEVASEAEVEGRLLAGEGPFLGRTGSRGSNGVGIHFLGEASDLNNRRNYQYFTKYLGERREYRCLIVGSRVKGIVVRRYIGASNMRDNPEDRANIIQSNGTGWEYQKYWSPSDTDSKANMEIVDELLAFAYLAIRYLGLSYGAIDIARNLGTRTYTFIEANTAPAFSSTVAEVIGDSLLTHVTARSIMRRYRGMDTEVRNLSTEWLRERLGLT